ncbi:MAG: hypothetical protein AAGD14_09505 [Planctomycetota bacterium]
MRILIAIALVLIGTAVGWFLRGAVDAPPTRAHRTDRGASEPVVVVRSSPMTESAPAPSEPAREDPDPEPERETRPASDPESKPDPEQAKMAKIFRGMLPIMRMQFAREAKEEAAQLRERLGLTDEQEKKFAEILRAFRLRAIEEGVLPLMEGVEPTPETYALLQTQDGIAPALETELGTALSAHQIERYKEHNREVAAKQRAEEVEESFKALAIPDLDEEQARQVRAVLDVELRERGGQAGMSGGGFSFRMKSDESVQSSPAERLQKRRERLAPFLRPDQLEHLDRMHAEELESIAASEKLTEAWAKELPEGKEK